MRILISGAGDVGFYLAKQLSRYDHHITVIDPVDIQLNRADREAEVLTINGSSTSFRILQKANVQNTDLLLAVTNSEEINIITAILAKQMGVKETLARVSNGEYVRKNLPIDFKQIGVDHLIYPEELAALEIVQLIERAAATDIHDFEEGKLTLIGLKLDRDAIVLKRSIQDIMMDIEGIDFRIVMIKRRGQTMIPTGKERLFAGDQIIVITVPEGLKLILKLAGKEKTKLNNIMLLGGGKIGRATARLLEKKYNLKLLEADSEKATELADMLKHTLVLLGDGRDIKLLTDEGIKEMDAFIAVTEDAETNIISGLMAKEFGVEKTIAYVENAEYTQLTQTVGIDSLINKKLITANYIAKLVRKANIVALTNIHGMDAEVLEYAVHDNCKLTMSPLKNLEFPPGAIIGGVVRNNNAFIAVGDTMIKVDDRVVVFALPGAIKKVEEFFQKC